MWFVHFLDKSNYLPVALLLLRGILSISLGSLLISVTWIGLTLLLVAIFPVIGLKSDCEYNICRKINLKWQYLIFNSWTFTHPPRNGKKRPKKLKWPSSQFWPFMKSINLYQTWKGEYSIVKSGIKFTPDNISWRKNLEKFN